MKIKVTLFVLQSQREVMMFYPTDPSETYGLFALRLGKYKAHFYTRGTVGFIQTYLLNWAVRAKAEVRCFWPQHVHICTTGASHSSTTPDQDCSMFASLKFHDPPLLFDLEADPSEHYPLQLEDRPDLQALLERIKKVKEQFEASMVFGESQISKGTDPSLAPCCNPQCSPKPSCCHCWGDIVTTAAGQQEVLCWFYINISLWKHKFRNHLIIYRYCYCSFRKTILQTIG